MILYDVYLDNGHVYSDNSHHNELIVAVDDMDALNKATDILNKSYEGCPKSYFELQPVTMIDGYKIILEKL